MASYQEHLAKQQARQAANGDVKIHFMNEFLKEEDDVAIIRFPYRSMDDITYTATHKVPMPGAPYGRRIRCTETPDCELCAQKLKIEERVFLKFLTYTVDETGAVVLNCTVWDRPAAFADLDLKGLIAEYGDLSKCLFKIKRVGSGTNTRYNFFPVINTDVYNPQVYKADFTELEKVNAEGVLSKSIEQYHQILNPETAPKKSVAEAVTHVQPQTPQYTQPQYSQATYGQQPQPQMNYQQPQMNYQQYAQPQVMPNTQAMPQPQVQPQPVQPAQPSVNMVTPNEGTIATEPASVTPGAPSRPQGRYTF